jgi:hypothetical protein
MATILNLSDIPDDGLYPEISGGYSSNVMSVRDIGRSCTIPTTFVDKTLVCSLQISISGCEDEYSASLYHNEGPDAADFRISSVLRSQRTCYSLADQVRPLLQTPADAAA